MAIRVRKGEGGSPIGFNRDKYRPEDFIVPGQDHNGNSMRVWCRVIPMLDRAVDVMFSSRKFPFKSKGDLIRWCIKLGVERLEEMEPVNGSVMTQVDAMLGVLRDEQLNHSFLTLFHTMNTTVGMHVQAQAFGEARRVIALMRFQILKMQNGYWRDRYLKELDEKFGHLMKGHATGMGEFTDMPDLAEGVDEEDNDG